MKKKHNAQKEEEENSKQKRVNKASTKLGLS